jgi:hypothetical protein
MAVDPQSPTDLAGLYLRTNKLPDTPENRAVLGSWLVKESGRSNSQLIAAGNPRQAITYHNPLGILGTGDMGKGPGTRYAYYSTWEAGAVAWGSLVKNNYPDIWEGFKTNNPTNTQQAITDSRWVTGHPFSNNYGSRGGIGSTYASLLAVAKKQLSVPIDYTGERGSGTTPETLSGFGNGVTFPVGHILTKDDVDKIMATLETQDAYKGYDPVSAQASREQIRSVLEKQIGNPWSREMLVNIQTGLGNNAQSANVLGSNLEKGIEAASNGIGLPGFELALGKVPAFIALAFGGIVMVVGVIMIARDQTDMPREHPIFRPTPIILKDNL